MRPVCRGGYHRRSTAEGHSWLALARWRGKGISMIRLAACRAAAFASLMTAAIPAGAAAPDAQVVEPAAPAAIGITAPGKYTLETEMTVHNWVLCISQPMAEELVHARAAGVDQARQAYAGLASSRSCGQFPELRVILRDPLYSSAADAGYDARIFGALVNLSGDWASAYVVSGGL